MIQIESNLKEVTLRVSNDISVSDAEMERALREGAFDAIALVQNRVQQRGEGVNGRLQTKSTNNTGVYSRGHAKRRSEGGFQTGNVDLTMTGDLWRNWQILESGPNEVGVGFMDGNSGVTKSNDLAEYLEDYYGSIFGLTDDEQNIVAHTVEERFIFQR